MNLLIDGSSLLWRTHYANVAQERSSVDNNVHSFLKSLKSYAIMHNCKKIYIAWDKKAGDGKNFRQTETDGEYKGQRDRSQAEVVYESQPKIDYATSLLGCKNMYPNILEADDIIAWLSHTLTGHNIIVTTDQDMLQLINSNTSVFSPKKRVLIDKQNFESIMKMPIEHFLPYKAILGDVSDNISGIYGCGPVGSKKLAKLWVEDKSSIDSEKTEIIEKNIRLMDLTNGYKEYGEVESDFYQKQVDELENVKLDIDLFKQFCTENKFISILYKLDEWENTFKSPFLFDILR